MKSFYIFVNTKSGNGEGAKLIELGSNQKPLFQTDCNISLQVIDLFDGKKSDLGFKMLRQQQFNTDNTIYLIVGGGDGTVSWIINDLVSNSIRISNLIFGILPIGTGNDMCRSLGWSVDQFEMTREALIKRIKVWAQSLVAKYDIWNVTLETFKNGKIYDIHNKKQHENESQTLTKIFTNYVGLGLDARVVYTMQRYRTSSACVNKILYGLVGCINFFRPMKELYRKVMSFTDKNYVDKDQTEADSIQQIGVENIKIYNERISLNNASVSVKRGYRGIVCLNCTSYMTGLRKVWQTTAVASRQSLYEWKPQSTGDGIIQFAAYKTELNLALQRIMRSGAKVAQGNGPFEIILNRPQTNEAEFVQIDGESILIKSLRSIRIQKCKQVEESQINVLICK